MSVISRELASGPGWRVEDVVCSSGPQDRPFEEQHGAACIALVTSGTFQYRTRQGAAVLGPGTMLLGNAGACFECGHDHSAGDRCLSFHLTPRFQEAVASAVPGVRSIDFARAALPPLPQLARLRAEAAAAGEERDVAVLEEMAVRLAGAVATLLAHRTPTMAAPSARDARRVADALRYIEAKAHERLSLAQLAAQVRMSSYHFLRTFRQIVGMTPHQYVLRTRLHRAALQLRQADEPILTVALNAGFEDLSSFNRRFRKIMGTTPARWRRQ